MTGNKRLFFSEPPPIVRIMLKMGPPNSCSLRLAGPSLILLLLSRL